MAGPALDNRVVRFRDGFEPIDAKIYRLEAGLMSFALLAMSVTYFLKIVFEAVIAERSFVDSFLLRWMHGVETQPPPELVAAVHGTYSPTIVAVLLVTIAVGAARAIRVQKARQAAGNEELNPPWDTGTALLALGIGAGVLVLGWLVVNVHSAALCGVVYAVSVIAFGLRAKRQGDLVPYAITWAVLSIPIGVLIVRIPGQYAWVNDLSKVLIMYVGFIGASMASRERKHIVLNFGRRLWPAGREKLVEGQSLLLWLLFDLLLLALAFHLFELQLSAGSTLSILPIPEYHIVLPVVLAFALMSLRVAVDLVRVIRNTPSYREGSPPPSTEPASSAVDPSKVEQEAA